MRLTKRMVASPFEHAGATPASGRGRLRIGRSFVTVLALYLIFAASVAATTVQVLHHRSTAAPEVAAGLGAFTPAAPKYLVLMVLDGARPDYFGLTSLPHVDALRSAGTEYTNTMSGILEAETPAGHATIATGSRPDRDGILGFDWANDDDRYSLFNPDKMPDLVKIFEDGHVPTIAGLYKQRFPEAKVVALSGHKYYAAAPLGGPAADAILYYEGDSNDHYVPVAVPGHVPPKGVLDAPGVTLPTTHLPNGAEDNLATKLALSSVSVMHPRILMINYPEFDWPLGHVDGGSLNPDKVASAMRGFDIDLGKIEDAYRKAGILNQTVFVITADHGMMPITRFVPASLVNDAVTKAGTTAPDIAANSGDFIWLADITKAQAVAQNIMDAHDPGIQSAYYLTTVSGKPKYVSTGADISGSQEEANQYLLSGLINGHQPAVVVFGHEGTSFSDPKSNWKADHGGGSWESEHAPLIITGPGIRSGVVSDTPAQLDDIAPTVLTDMGVTPTGMEGTVLADALEHPSSANLNARNAETSQLSTVVAGLQADTGNSSQ